MARQTSIAATAIIAAPPERVREIACDSSRYPEWAQNTLRMIHTDGPTRPGTTMKQLTRIAGPCKATTRWRVTRIRAAAAAGATGRGSHHREGHGGDHRAVTLRRGHRLHPHRPLRAPVRPDRRLIDRVVRGSITRSPQRSARAFAELVAREYREA